MDDSLFMHTFFKEILYLWKATIVFHLDNMITVLLQSTDVSACGH